jgi:hypothetical protein
MRERGSYDKGQYFTDYWKLLDIILRGAKRLTVNIQQSTNDVTAA